MKTLAECLLRRKELQDKLISVERIKTMDLFEVKVSRMKVSDSIDDVTVQTPKLEYNQVVAEYNHISKQLRMIDAIIQRTNWTTEINDADELFIDFEERK